MLFLLSAALSSLVPVFEMPHPTLFVAELDSDAAKDLVLDFCETYSKRFKQPRGKKQVKLLCKEQLRSDAHYHLPQ